MQPYQKATEEIRRQGEIPLESAKNVASIGASAGGAYLAGGTINKVLPFLSKYIPQDLAIKGLSKVDPRYGKFINKAFAAGKTIEEVKDFIGQKIEEGAEGQQGKEDRNIIQQYSPELHTFLSNEISAGRPPLEAATKAQKDKKFSEVINKISKDHKASWADIIQSIYGSGEHGGVVNPKQEALRKFNEHKKKKSLAETETERFQNQYVAQQPQQQGGQGQAALMAILQKIQQSRGVK